MLNIVVGHCLMQGPQSWWQQSALRRALHHHQGYGYYVLRTGGSGSGFSIREDTNFFSLALPAEAPAAAAGPGQGSTPAPLVSAPAPAFEIREDTQFVPGVEPASRNGGGFSIREDTQFISAATGAGVASGGGGGFSVREDTHFLSAPAAAVGSSSGVGFSIREDTQFMGPFAAAAQGSGFSIPEDTEYLAVPAAAGRAQGPTAKPAAGLHARGGKAPAVKDAAAEAQVSKWGFAPGADDTLQLDLGHEMSDILADTQVLGASAPAGTSPSALTAALRQSAGPSSGLAKHMRGLRLSEVG